MLSDLQTKKLIRYFQVYDIDDDGRIDAADFERIVENVRLLHGADSRSREAEALRSAYLRFWSGLRSQADGDEDGGVDLDEWLAYWQRVLEDDGRYQEEVQVLTRRLLDIFDLDENEAIGPSEFADFYGIFGLPVSLARSVFVELDADGDGQISRAELLKITGVFYRGTDAEASGNLLFGPYGV
ncbi:MAG: hypothetical protein R3304_06440 [Longimicrobiales bacterium]|nr:hypothetical protein [Longimicrobiales bacterium]